MIVPPLQLKECSFNKAVLDNMNFQENYLEMLYYQIHTQRGDEQIKFFQFFMIVQAFFDHEFFLSVTGNLDADL